MFNQDRALRHEGFAVGFFSTERDHLGDFEGSFLRKRFQV